MTQDATLSAINDWPQRAHAAHYCVKTLARNFRVSVRRLERFFALAFGQPPHQWLHELWMRRAIELLRAGSLAKETAYLLGYKDGAHLTHDFKKHFEIPPSKAAAIGLAAPNPYQMSLFDKRCRV